MTSLTNKQISEVINNFYKSVDFLRIITNVSQKLEINGAHIEGDIIVDKNVNVDGEIRNNIISFTEIEKKIDILEDKRIFRITTTPFREFTLNIGSPYLKDMIENVWYWIYATHHGVQFVWGFFLRKIDNKTTLNFYNNNMQIKPVTNELLPINCVRRLIQTDTKNKEGYNEWFLPTDNNNFGIPYLIKLLKYTDNNNISNEFINVSTEPINSSNLPKKKEFEKQIILASGSDIENKIGCTIRQNDTPSINLSFFEGWRNSKLPFKQMKNTKYDWRSAFDLYKSSTSIPSFSFQ